MDIMEKVEVKESVPTGKTKRSVSTWVETLRTPTFKSGRIFKRRSGYEIWCLLGQDDLTTKASTKFSKTYNVFVPSGCGEESSSTLARCQVMDGVVTPGLDSKFICFSPSGRKKAVLIEGGSGSDSKEILQIWVGDSVHKSYDLKELDIHKTIYCPGAFGTTVVWSPDETKLAYLAEKKIPKAEPFFSSNARRKRNEDCDPENISRGEEYAFRQTWGEQLESFVQPVIVILDPATDSFKYFSLPHDDFPTDLQWVGNASIIGTAILSKFWRLGLIYCTNRESRIFQIDEHGFCYLSDPKRVALCPRVVPTHDYVLWQDREMLGPHNSSRNVLYRRISTVSIGNRQDETERPHIVQLGNNGEGESYNVNENFPANCFSSVSNNLYFLTALDCKHRLLRITKSGETFACEVLSDAPEDIDAIFDVEDGFLLIQSSTSVCTQSLRMLQVELLGPISSISLSKAVPIAVPIPELSLCKIAATTLTPPSILVKPRPNPINAKMPLVVIPHGGPHAGFVDSFDHETVHFIKLGFAVLKVNYIGSTGSKVDSTRELIGHIGELEVPQIQKIVEGCIEESSDLDIKNVFLCGGSHGGFIIAHLISKYPDYYKAAVLRNPVIDLNTMIGTSDITDWIYVEGGVAYTTEESLVPESSKTEIYEKLRNLSPITRADQVKCPVLLHLGTKDLRVPMSQGLLLYRKLKSLGKHVELQVYDDNHALYTPPVRANARVQIVRFFNKFADPTVFDD